MQDLTCLLTMDTGDKVKERLGAQLKLKRMAAGLTVMQLAESAKKYLNKNSDPRTYIHALEAGRANSTIENYATLFGLCGVTLDSVVTGLWENRAAAPEVQRLHDLLSSIAEFCYKKDQRMFNGLEMMLEALAEKVNHLRKVNATKGPGLEAPDPGGGLGRAREATKLKPRTRRR